jgi:hypothetical protein
MIFYFSIKILEYFYTYMKIDGIIVEYLGIEFLLWLDTRFTFKFINLNTQRLVDCKRTTYQCSIKGIDLRDKGRF